MNKKLENLINKLVEKLWKREYPNFPLVIDNKTGYYWDGEGKYEKGYHKLYELLIPKKYGCSDTGAECLRVLSTSYYRYYNDGDKISADIYKKIKEFLKEK